MTWACCVAPGAPEAAAAALQAVKVAAEERPSNPVLARAYGAALYRARHYNEAAKQLEAALAVPQEGAAPSVALLLALTYQQQGKTAEARKLLAQARAWVAQSRREPLAAPLAGAVGLAAGPSGPLAAAAALVAQPPTPPRQIPAWNRIPWGDRVAVEVLLKEAEKQIAGIGRRI
jgi:tetratricopeptide (TPR) repeat protein